MTDKNDTNGNGNQPPLPEAPASITTKVYDSNGFEVRLTVRDYSMSDLLKKWIKFSEYLMDNGYTPTNAPRPAAPPQAPPEPTPADIEAQANPERVAASQPQQAAAVPPAAGGQSFMAEKLVASMTDGKTYWKIKGGIYQRYGVTVWPEVLQAAQQAGLYLSDGELNPAQEYPLGGWIAHFVINEKGQPQKVTQLQSATAG